MHLSQLVAGKESDIEQTGKKKNHGVAKEKRDEDESSTGTPRRKS